MLFLSLALSSKLNIVKDCFDGSFKFVPARPSGDFRRLLITCLNCFDRGQPDKNQTFNKLRVFAKVFLKTSQTKETHTHAHTCEITLNTMS